MPLSRHRFWGTPREYARFSVDLRLTVRTSAKFYGRTRDISEGGLGATVAGEMTALEIVELEFQLPDGEPINLLAEIRYRKGFQYGFKFVNATQHQRNAIRRATRILPVVR